MEKQLSFSDCEYAGKKRQTKREAFLSKMELLVPWKEWVHLIEPFYPTGQRDGHRLAVNVCYGCYLFRVGTICPMKG